MIQNIMSEIQKSSPWRARLSAMGPGLLLAGAAIGVSHLVQSTRAGANFGYQLIALVLLANFLKYPFFEFGHRYALAKKESLLAGYMKVSPHFVRIFILLALVTSVGTMAGVTLVTGSLLFNLLGQSLSIPIWCAITLLVCALLLLKGKYSALDGFMKVLMFVLFIATFSALFAAFMSPSTKVPDFVSPSAYSLATLPFLIALMGWMPAPVETSVWQSLWMIEKSKSCEEIKDRSHCLFDFNFGYVITALLAVGFICLGALVMHGTGQEFSASAGKFTAQVIDLYTQNLGEWSRPLIALAAFATMFSTTLTCFDAYPRSLSAAVGELSEKQTDSNKLYFYFLLWSGIGGLLIIFFFVSHLKTLIDLVTSIAFLTAPVFAYMNYKLIFSEHMPDDLRPGFKMKLLCWLGLAYLIGFCFLFVFS